MDYLKVYYQLINKAQNENKDGYLELHHIVPRSVYGENILPESHLKNVNDEENLVYLSAREHFIAHWLLHRSFPENKNLGLAFWAMTAMFGPDQDRDYIPSSRIVAEAREAAANARRVPVLQYSLNGEFIKEHKSVNDAAETVGIVPTSIGSCLNGRNKSSGGYQWTFKTKNYPKLIEPYFADNNGLPVGEYSLDGNLLARYDSALDVERKTGLLEATVRASMNKGTKIRGRDSVFIQYHKHQRIPEQIEPFQQPLHGFSIPVVQISPDGKYFIDEFPSITHAAASIGKNTGHISAACLGKRETAYGFQWKYKTNYKDNLPARSKEQVIPKLHSKPVAQYDLDGNYIGRYKSASEAARQTGIEQSNISSAASGNRSYAGNFQWAYMVRNDVPVKGKVELSENIAKRVLQLSIDTEELIDEHDSVGAAARAISGAQGNISAVLTGRRKSAYGYKWRYKE